MHAPPRSPPRVTLVNYSLAHLGDAALLRDLSDLVVRDRSNTALLLAHIAEVDARRLYLPAAYSSMHAYCMGELKLSEYGAHKRIRAARAAREFPALFHAIADGRIYTMDGRAGISARNEQDGSQIWRVDLAPRSGRDREAYGGGLAVVDGVLYVASGYRFVTALDAATGAVKWRTAMASPIHASTSSAWGKSSLGAGS